MSSNRAQKLKANNYADTDKMNGVPVKTQSVVTFKLNSPDLVENVSTFGKFISVGNKGNVDILELLRNGSKVTFSKDEVEITSNNIFNDYSKFIPAVRSKNNSENISDLMTSSISSSNNVSNKVSPRVNVLMDPKCENNSYESIPQGGEPLLVDGEDVMLFQNSDSVSISTQLVPKLTVDLNAVNAFTKKPKSNSKLEVDIINDVPNNKVSKHNNVATKIMPETKLDAVNSSVPSTSANISTSNKKVKNITVPILPIAEPDSQTVKLTVSNTKGKDKLTSKPAIKEKRDLLHNEEQDDLHNIPITPKSKEQVNIDIFMAIDKEKKRIPNFYKNLATLDNDRQDVVINAILYGQDPALPKLSDKEMQLCDFVSNSPFKSEIKEKLKEDEDHNDFTTLFRF